MDGSNCLSFILSRWMDGWIPAPDIKAGWRTDGLMVKSYGEKCSEDHQISRVIHDTQGWGPQAGQSLTASQLLGHQWPWKWSIYLVGRLYEARTRVGWCRWNIPINGLCPTLCGPNTCHGHIGLLLLYGPHKTWNNNHSSIPKKRASLLR